LEEFKFMQDWNRLKERFLKDTISTRMGGTAANLSRIKTLTQKAISRKTIEYLFQESKYFIEWMVRDVDVEIAVEFVELQRQIVNWQIHWAEIWDTLKSAKRSPIAPNFGQIAFCNCLACCKR
jgi:hypothetical protein